MPIRLSVWEWRRIDRQAAEFNAEREEFVYAMLVNELHARDGKGAVSMGCFSDADRKVIARFRRWQNGIRRILKQRRAVA